MIYQQTNSQIYFAVQGPKVEDAAITLVNVRKPEAYYTEEYATADVQKFIEGGEWKETKLSDIGAAQWEKGELRDVS